jgi:hypothetical protein
MHTKDELVSAWFDESGQVRVNMRQRVSALDGIRLGLMPAGQINP